MRSMRFIFMLTILRVNHSELVVLPPMGRACPYQPLPFILWHTHFYSKYRDTENVQFWGSQQNQTAIRCQLLSEIDVKIA